MARSEADGVVPPPPLAGEGRGGGGACGRGRETIGWAGSIGGVLAGAASDGPEEACKLAGDGGYGHLRSLSVVEELAIATAQAVARLVGNGEQRLWVLRGGWRPSRPGIG